MQRSPVGTVSTVGNNNINLNLLVLIALIFAMCPTHASAECGGRPPSCSLLGRLQHKLHCMFVRPRVNVIVTSGRPSYGERVYVPSCEVSQGIEYSAPTCHTEARITEQVGVTRAITHHNERFTVFVDDPRGIFSTEQCKSVEREAAGMIDKSDAEIRQYVADRLDPVVQVRISPRQEISRSESVKKIWFEKGADGFSHLREGPQPQREYIRGVLSENAPPGLYPGFAQSNGFIGDREQDGRGDLQIIQSRSGNNVLTESPADYFPDGERNRVSWYVNDPGVARLSSLPEAPPRISRYRQVYYRR